MTPPPTTGTFTGDFAKRVLSVDADGAIGTLPWSRTGERALYQML